MDIIKIVDNDKTKYMDLLLIADEQIDMIEKYLYRGEMFALYDNELKSICVVTQEEPGLYEIKNIVTAPEHQKKGYGQQLISFVANYYKDFGKELYLGTWTAPKLIMSLSVPIFFIMLILSAWKRNWKWLLGVIVGAAVLKFLWSISFSGEAGMSILKPALIGLLLCIGVLFYYFKKPN